MNHPDLILHNGKISTLHAAQPEVSALAIEGGRISSLGGDELRALAGSSTRVVDLKGRRVVPGLNDSHLHLIRGGLNYNLELRWDGVSSLSDALQMLKEQVARTPAPQWVRVVGGWSEFQFKERRMPTLDEINAIAPDTPVFILHLYCRALLNGAALRACGYDASTPDPPGGEIVRDKNGNPTGLLLARPNATILYSSLAKGPKLPPEYQLNSTRHFMRELNRLGVTSCIDAGGGFQNYPEDYTIVRQLHERGEMTIRIAYNLFTQHSGQEKADFQKWIGEVKPGDGDEYFRMNGAGEMLVFSAADFEDFLEPRPDLAPSLEDELHGVVSLLAANKWPFRLHATYDEFISRFLDVFESVHRETPIDKLGWFFDHAETVSDRNLDRIAALGGGVAIQHRMAFQGEYFVERYGAEAARRTPPIRQMLERGLPVGAGTDATRVANYNPFNALHWLVSGKTAGGLRLYDHNRLQREEALQLYTVGSSWFSHESGVKGTLAPGQLADLAALSNDYFAVEEDDIKNLESVLTIVGGKIVYAAQEFSPFDPPPVPVMPDWSPVKHFGGYGAPQYSASAAHVHHASCSHSHAPIEYSKRRATSGDAFWGAGSGCACWAF